MEKVALIFGNKFKQVQATIQNDKIQDSRTFRLLGVTMYNELKSQEQLTST